MLAANHDALGKATAAAASLIRAGVSHAPPEHEQDGCDRK